MRPGGRRDGHVQRPVPAEPERPGLPRDRRADRGRPGGGDRGERNRIAAPAARQLSVDLAADALHQRTSPGDTARSCAGSPGSASAAVAVTTVWAAREIMAASARRRSPSSSERTSSRSTSGEIPEAVAQRVGLRHHEGEHRDPLLSLRAEHAEVSAVRFDAHVVQMRPCTCHASVDVGLQSVLELGHRHGLSLVSQRRRAESQCAGGLRERLGEERQRFRPCTNQLLTQRNDPPRPRCERVPRRLSGTDAAQSSVALPDSRRVVVRERRACWEQPPHCAVEVRAACRRSALHDGEAVGREHECRQLVAKPFSRSEPLPVEGDLARLARSENDVRLERVVAGRRREASPFRRSRRSGSSARRGERAARTPAFRRGAPPAGSSSRRRSSREAARLRVTARARERRTSGSRGA